VQFVAAFKESDAVVVHRDVFSAATGWGYCASYIAEHKALIQHGIEWSKLCTVISRKDDVTLHRMKTGKDLVLLPLSGNDRSSTLIDVTNVHELAVGLLRPMEQVSGLQV
jgi:hypothetical protein